MVERRVYASSFGMALPAVADDDGYAYISAPLTVSESTYYFR